MKQKILELKEGKKCKTFRYYRYKVAEWLHKFVNLITWTPAKEMGHAYRFTEEDLNYLRKEAKEEGVTYEEKEKELSERWHKQMIDNLLRQLEMDGYLDKTAKHNEDGGIDIGFTFKMIAFNSTQIFNEDNAVSM